MRIDVRANVKAVKAGLTRLQRQQLPFATALALTRTAQIAQRELIAEMPRVFDAPIRYTLGGTFIRPATKTKLLAYVGLKDFAPKGTPAAKYLLPEIEGGPRRHKRFERALIHAGIMRANEYAVPGDDLRLNTSGNIPPGQISAMLSQLRASPDEMQHASQSARSKKSRATRAYFYREGFRGVFRRTGRKAITVFLKFVRLPRYRRRLNLKRIVEGTVQARFTGEMKRAMMIATRTAK